jgi:hypothetical protein
MEKVQSEWQAGRRRGRKKKEREMSILNAVKTLRLRSNTTPGELSRERAISERKIGGKADTTEGSCCTLYPVVPRNGVLESTTVGA